VSLPNSVSKASRLESVLTSNFGAWTAFDPVAVVETSSLGTAELVEKSIALPRP